VSQLPFYPMAPEAPSPQYQYAYQQPQQPQPYQYVPAYVPQEQPALECHYCRSKIEPGDDVAEIFFGIAGIVKQTGLPGTIHPPGGRGKTEVIHRSCYLQHAIEDVCAEESDEILDEMAIERAQEMMQSIEEEERLEERYRQRIHDEYS
jgi:hypothetical protein